MAIVGNISLSDPKVESKTKLLWWQKLGMSYTASGYGKKVPTTKMVRHNDRWRRVYCCIFSNAGTCYIETKSGDWITVDD